MQSDSFVSLVAFTCRPTRLSGRKPITSDFQECVVHQKLEIPTKSYPHASCVVPFILEYDYPFPKITFFGVIRIAAISFCAMVKINLSKNECIHKIINLFFLHWPFGLQHCHSVHFVCYLFYKLLKDVSLFYFPFCFPQRQSAMDIHVQYDSNPFLISLDASYIVYRKGREPFLFGERTQDSFPLRASGHSELGSRSNVK